MELVVVDAFTSEAFGGNPAGVCFLDGERTDAWMAAVAAEMKHAETAFLLPRADGSYGLRWFTPETEVALCGHATLASAHALWDTARLDPNHPAIFHTLSGELRAQCRSDGRVELDFPVAKLVPAPDGASVLAALGVAPAPVFRTSFFVLVELTDATAVRGLTPDLTALGDADTDAVLVTAPSDDERFDVCCRVFGPRIGIPEDSVTGSAMCVLAPYWQPRLGDELRVEQVSARRGELHVRLAGDRVLIAGHAVTVLRGELLA
ncbi:MAG: PhzF family phenazine biosynthesis protein [Acidimicrobiia bacterium]